MSEWKNVSCLLTYNTNIKASHSSNIAIKNASYTHVHTRVMTKLKVGAVVITNVATIDVVDNAQFLLYKFPYYH